MRSLSFRKEIDTERKIKEICLYLGGLHKFIVEEQEKKHQCFIGEGSREGLIEEKGLGVGLEDKCFPVYKLRGQRDQRHRA